MTRNKFSKLEPFLYHREARQRVILYLVASGTSPGELIRMTVKDPNKINFIEDMDEYTEQIIEEKTMTERVFTYPNGNPLSHSAFYRCIGDASERVTGRRMSCKTFQQYMN